VLAVSLALALLALALGLVAPREVRGLLDWGVLSLFFVLIVAVECAKHSALYQWLVRRVLSRVRTERGLAVAAVLCTGLLAAFVTNDVALLLVVPFTFAFEAADPRLDPAPVVVLEIHAANLLGCLTPAGNPQNLFLYARGGFTPARFFAAQLPWVAGMTAATLLLVPLLLPRRALAPPPESRVSVAPLLAGLSLALLALEFLAIFHAVPPWVPVLAALPGLVLLRGKARLRDFALVAVFACLFVGIEGVRRSAPFRALDPIGLLSERAAPWSFVVAGALLSQAVSNVPAALLLAPTAAAAGGGTLFTALLYGVNAGGCGTPIASLANLIGGSLYFRGRSRRRPAFWPLFLKVSTALLAVAIALSLALLSLG
jgi:Na+/H+ antiporter NhaD/arsenite permease-like protein